MDRRRFAAADPPSVAKGSTGAEEDAVGSSPLAPGSGRSGRKWLAAEGSVATGSRDEEGARR